MGGFSGFAATCGLPSVSFRLTRILSLLTVLVPRALMLVILSSKFPTVIVRGLLYRHEFLGVQRRVTMVTGRLEV